MIGFIYKTYKAAVFFPENGKKGIGCWGGLNVVLDEKSVKMDKKKVRKLVFSDKLWWSIADSNR